MLVEAEAIPYEPAPLRGERLLVLAPHPDDEVIGCGGLVAQHLDAGRSVRIVIATDGTKATGAASDAAAFRDLREQESRLGLAALGGTAELVFLRFPDRALDDKAAASVAEQLRSYQPDLICVPSPVEIHPDHLALSRIVCELIQRDETLFADLATARVAFYEVSQPLRPNTIVDITAVADRKYAAIAAHESQVALKDYVAYARGLNAYRAMTLPAGVKAAEAYHVVGLSSLRTTAFSELRRMTGPAAPVEIVRPELAISVIVRTKDRPALLREAIQSATAGDLPAEIVVVNDGGQRPQLEGIKVVNHEQPRGRSEAMNSGVRSATGTHLAFLDDDDLFYPEHLPTLASAAGAAPGKAAWYTDAVSSFQKIGEEGTYETRDRQRIFARDFDRAALLADNYIPLTTLLVRRADFLDLGGFDPAFDLFEDWDFLIRLSERGDFLRVPRVTCEVRHFAGGESITLAAPEGSDRFRRAKLQVWTKHAARTTLDVFASVQERQKRELQSLTANLIEEKGRSGHARQDIARLEREKQQLLAQLADLHEKTNAKLIYIQQLEGKLGTAQLVADQARQAAEDAGKVLDATRESLRAFQSEAERLQGLLDMIFRSRTWKVHTMLERLRGRR